MPTIQKFVTYLRFVALSYNFKAAVKLFMFQCSKVSEKSYKYCTLYYTNVQKTWD